MAGIETATEVRARVELVLFQIGDRSHVRCLRVNCSVCAANDFVARVRAALVPPTGGQ